MSSVAPDTVRSDQTYVRNMAALFRSDPGLAQRIDEVADNGTVRVEPSKRGAPTATVTVPGVDRSIYLHSRVDPGTEAKRLADSVDVSEAFCYIVGGFGLGHHVRALHERLLGEAFIIVTEPNLQLLKAAMESVDLAELFAKNRCIILTEANKSNIQTRLEPYNTLIMMGAQFVSHPPSERVDNAFQVQMRKLLADHMTYCRMSLVTLVANSRVTSRNVAFNLPAYLSTPPIDVLRDRFAGHPAIVVSAGPSLRRNIDVLARLQGKAVIVAVQTTFKMLLDRGITPDFVTSLDFHEMSKRFFEGVPADCRTHLVAEPKVTHHVIDTYKGPTSLLHNNFARLCLGDDLAARDGLKAGATVAHLAFYLAVYMGCEPIMLVGQDLGYTDHVYYTPGVAMHDMWRPDLNRFSTIEMKEWERIVRSRNILMKVKDLNGHDIYTDEQLFTYLQQFEGDFGALPGRVIDATEGGVHKANAQVMTLAEAAERYCRRELPAEAVAYRDTLDWCDRSKIAEGKARIERRFEEVVKMSDTCDEMLRVLEELTGLTDKPGEFNRRIGRVDALRIQIRQMRRTYEAISAVSQLAELQRFSADARMATDVSEGAERAKRQLERDIRFVRAVRDGADALREILRACKERFEAV